MNNSITKNKQSEEKLKEIVKRAFNNELQLTESKELPEGFCNVAYELTLSNGQSVILKIAPREGIVMLSNEVELMKTEVGAMKLAEENNISGVAKVLDYQTDTSLCGASYFIMEKLDGQSFASIRQSLTSEQQEDILFQIGQELAKVNQIKGTKFGHFCVEQYRHTIWYDAFYEMVDRILNDGSSVSVEIGIPFDDVRQKLASHRNRFLEVTEPRLIHYDSWDGNIFVKENRFYAMIDWERAMWAEGLMEDRFRFHNQGDAFRRGYNKTVFTENETIRCLWYDVYLYLIMMFEGAFRHYDNDGQYRWVRGLFDQVWEKLCTY